MIILLFLILLMAGGGCSQRLSSGKEPVISVSILPLQYFVDQLSGENLEVNVMIPHGASHGTYSPTTRQMQKLSDSEMYLRIGSLGYEYAFIDRLQELNPRMQVLDLTRHVELIRGVIDHGDHVHEGGIDPHIWMSPRVMLSLLPVMRDGLLEAYPHLQQQVESNYPALFQQVLEIDKQMDQLTRELQRKRFMIFHPALTYLARDYGLEQISIEHEGKEPGPGQLGRLIQAARDETIRVIFIQAEYDQRNASLVSRETGAQIIQINPLEYNWPRNMNHLMEIFNQYMR